MLFHEYRAVNHCLCCHLMEGLWGGVGGGEEMEFVAMQWYPGESGVALCIQPVNEISGADFLLGSAPRPDSQTWKSSCEPSVRCVRSQRGGRTPITAALSRQWFPLSPLDHTHACQPPVCRSHWSPHSRLSAVVWFRLGGFKSINSSRRTDTHQWGTCVLSCPDAACHWVCEKKQTKKIPPDWTMLPCSLVPNPQTWPEILWWHYRQL